ncbi:MAG: hypothetical protein ACLSVD_01175 [Eggerthellaceae bacterium]
MQTDETKDATTATAKKTDVPNLAAVLGMTKDEAIAALKHGATETTSKEVNEEGNPVKTNVTVALTDEPADTRSGTPTVYLGLNEDGAVVQAGYSAATASLGYGSLSFVDAVKNEGIIEKTLQEAGVNVPAGSAQLPADKTEYSEYASDGTTLVKESYSFSGTVDLNEPRTNGRRCCCTTTLRRTRGQPRRHHPHRIRVRQRVAGFRQPGGRRNGRRHDQPR